MSFWLHISIHIFLALAAGLAVYKIYRKPILAAVFGFVSGVLIDLDHLFDYFMAFDANFSPNYFLNSYQFLKTDKMYVVFHAWEYALILLILFLLLKGKTARVMILSSILGFLLHLSADVLINNIPPLSYSIIYRAKNDFKIEKLIPPEEYQKHLLRKSTLKEKLKIDKN